MILNRSATIFGNVDLGLSYFLPILLVIRVVVDLKRMEGAQNDINDVRRVMNLSYQDCVGVLTYLELAA